MISITTKRGDKGQTSLRDGSRVSKDDARVELNGELDELNALLGLCKAQTGLQKPFEDIQLQLMDFMAVIADNRTEPDAERIARLTEATTSMEQTINDFSAGYRFHFVLPGIDMADAVLHLAEAGCDQGDAQNKRHHLLQRKPIVYHHEAQHNPDNAVDKLITEDHFRKIQHKIKNDVDNAIDDQRRPDHDARK